MKFLNTKEVGFDYYSIGFPSVKTCQAIVYQTKFGLFGYHDSYGTSADFTKKCIAFNQFVQNHSLNHATLAVCLIGVITREERFGKGQEAEWQAELVEVGDKLAFRGDIWGVRLEAHVEKNDSAYIRVDYATGQSPPLTVSFKTWRKMDYDYSKTLDPAASEFGMLQPRPLTNNDVAGMSLEQMKVAKENTPYDVTMPPLASRSVLRKGQTGEGKLNLAKAFVKLR